MAGTRPTRFEPRTYPGTAQWAVWDLLKQDWYLLNGKVLTDQEESESLERCQNLQRLFEFANPLPFLDENDSGPDFMDLNVL